MKILFLTRTLNTGGAERQLVNLALELKKKGHEIVVITFYGGENDMDRDLTENGVPTVSLEKRGRWDFFSFLLNLYQIAKKESPDLVHGYLGVPNILTICLKPFFSRSKMVWGVRVSFIDFSKYDWLVKLSYRIECLLSRFADLVIVNSYCGKQYSIDHGFSGKKMVVIPNGIDTDRFKPDIKSRESIRAELGFSENQFIIGIVARLDSMKDHPNFIQAFAETRRNHPAVVGLCVGAGTKEKEQELRSLARKNNVEQHIHWLGKRNDVPRCLNGLDICVSASLGEGFSNTIAEAMACGVPCVVTNVGDSAIIVDQYGVVVQPDNSDELAAGIEKMIARKIKEGDLLPDQVRDRIVRCFNTKKMVDTTEKYLLELISN